MARGIIWSVLIVSVFALTSCQKKAKEEAQPIEVQAVSLDESTQAATSAAASGAEQISGQISATAGTAAGVITDAAQTAATTVQDTMAVASGVYEKPSVEKIQEALKNAGFYAGSVDGKLGPKTKAAIEAFQSQNGLTADGKVGPKTWARLSQFLAAQAPAATSLTEPSSQITY